MLLLRVKKGEPVVVLEGDCNSLVSICVCVCVCKEGETVSVVKESGGGHYQKIDGNKIGPEYTH